MNKRVIKPRVRRNAKSPEYRRYFKHWRSGKVYDSYDYGHRGWPIGARGR